jgi:hypothetical protein
VRVLIDTLSGLKEKILKFYNIVRSGVSIFYGDFYLTNIKGEMYCPTCGEIRMMDICNTYTELNDTILKNTFISNEGDSVKAQQIIDRLLTPSLWNYTCRQCASTFTSLIYKGPKGQSIAVLPSCYGGLSTPNTPDSVAYYLDQANRAKSVSANSAAMAMYRAALDHILFEQGYTKGMLGARLNELEKDISNKKATRWAMDLETEFLNYLKEFGNESIHTNDGDITKQEKIDNDLLSKVDIVFSMLLFRIYEAKKKQEDWLDSFKRKIES